MTEQSPSYFTITEWFQNSHDDDDDVDLSQKLRHFSLFYYKILW